MPVQIKISNQNMAVYTKLTFEEIQNHLKNYDLGELLEFKEIMAGIDNSNFIINTQKGKFILTIFESRIDKNDLPFFINFKIHLAKNGICCPKPMLDNKGTAIVDLKQKKSAIVSFLSGATLQPRADGYYDNITPIHCFEVGKILAQLHLAALDFKGFRTNDLGFATFKNWFEKFENFLVDKNSVAIFPVKKGRGAGSLHAEILSAIDFVESRWNADLPEAPAHLDLFPDNVFFDEQEKIIGVIDFYFAANDLLIFDFAIVVNAWCFDENNIFDEEKFVNLKQGYELVRKMTPAEEDFLEIALVASSLRFLLTRVHDMFFTSKDSFVKVKDPREYLAKMRYFSGKINKIGWVG